MLATRGRPVVSARRRSHSPLDVAATAVITAAGFGAAVIVFWYSATSFLQSTIACASRCGSYQLLVSAHLVVWGGIGLAFVVGSAGIIITACTRRLMWPWALTPLMVMFGFYAVAAAMVDAFSVGR